MKFNIDQKYIVIGIIVLTIVVLFFMNRQASIGVKDIKESMQQGQDKPQIINYNASWCGWSKKLEPVWQKVMSTYENRPVDVIDLKCDESDNKKQMCNQAGIGGFPTIMGIVGGQKHTYQGDRSYDSLCSWINGICGF